MSTDHKFLAEKHVEKAYGDVDEAGQHYHLQTGIAHALLAVVDRLDALTDTQSRISGKVGIDDPA